jgi:hypothetical protein
MNAVYKTSLQFSLPGWAAFPVLGHFDPAVEAELVSVAVSTVAGASDEVDL